MMMRTTYHTFDDLKKLLETTEHQRLEFKSSALFYDRDGRPTNSYIHNLSKVISGFANTAGGSIVVGVITDRKENEPDKAEAFDDGLAYKDFPPQRIQQTLEASISPPLLGLRFLPIKTEKDPKRYYLVISVPKGHTAFQAKDLAYYGRSEFETTRLHDNVIRLLMTGSMKPHATVSLEDISVDRKTSDNKDYTHEYHVSFDVYVSNIGDVDITEFKLFLKLFPQFRCDHKAQNPQTESLFGEGVTYLYRDKLQAPEGSPHLGGSSVSQNISQGDQTESHISVNIFPKDRFFINRYEFTLECERINWTDEEIIDERIGEEEDYIYNIYSGEEDDSKFGEEVIRIHSAADNSLKLRWLLYLPNTEPLEHESYELVGHIEIPYYPEGKDHG